MKKFAIFAMVAALCFSMAMVAGCAKQKVAGPGELSAEEQARLAAERERRLREARLAEEQARGGEQTMREIFENQDVHFDYDRYDLSAEAKQILNDKAQFMSQHPEMMVIVEGHCDERGSNAYNMALGEKRAHACEQYLVAMGVGSDRIEVVSYGEEKPLVPGNTEEAYAANRRGHFVIK